MLTALKDDPIDLPDLAIREYEDGTFMVDPAQVLELLQSAQMRSLAVAIPVFVRAAFEAASGPPPDRQGEGNGHQGGHFESR